MAESYARAGRIIRSYGSQGKIVVEAVRGFSSLMRSGLDVWVVPPLLREDRHRRVMAVSHDSLGDVVTLSGVSTLSDAQQLVGRWLLARKGDGAGVALTDFSACVGAVVRDVCRGSLGKLIAVKRGPANDVWEIQTRCGVMLFPIRTEWVVDSSSCSCDGEIVIQLPEGALGVQDSVS